MAREGGEERKEGNGSRSGQGLRATFGLVPDAKQSNVLLILITEMILICLVARATLPDFSGSRWEGDGGR